MNGANRPADPALAREPSEAELRATLQELMDLYRSSTSIRVGRAKVPPFLALHGLIAHTINATEAALTLIDQGHVYVANALVRVAFEHAVIAQWAHQARDGIEGLLTKTEKAGRAFLGEVQGLTEVPESIIAAYESLPAPGTVPGAMNKFQEACRQFDPSGWLYVMYRSLSMSVHPSSNTQSHYLHYDPTTDIVNMRDQPTELDPTPALWTLTLAVVLTVGVHEDIRRGKPNKAKVRTLAAAVGMHPLPTLQPTQ